jgi:hypothetical protein
MIEASAVKVNGPLTGRPTFPTLSVMATAKTIKPTDKAIRAYYEALHAYQR